MSRTVACPVSGRGCGRCTTIRSAPFLSSTRDPDLSTTSTPTALSNDSMSRQRIPRRRRPKEDPLQGASVRSSHTDVDSTTSGTTAAHREGPARRTFVIGLSLRRRAPPWLSRETGSGPAADSSVATSPWSPANWQSSRPAVIAQCKSLTLDRLGLPLCVRSVYTRPDVLASLLGDPSCPPRQPACPDSDRGSPARPASESSGPRAASRVFWKKLLPARQPDSGASLPVSLHRHRSSPVPRQARSPSRSASPGSWSARRPWPPSPAATALSGTPPPPRLPKPTSRCPSPTAPNSRQNTPRRASRVFWKKLLPARGPRFWPTDPPPLPTRIPPPKLSRPPPGGTVRRSLPTGHAA